MINLYKSIRFFSDNEILIDNDSFFNNNISAKSLQNEKSLGVMSIIDNAKLLDNRFGKIETPFGITDISSLSLGCKTVLNYIFIHNKPDLYPNIKAINATECGWNALEELFKAVESNKDNKIAIIVEHDNDLFKCADREYCINGEKLVYSSFEI
jgi:hypothetical protein